MYSPLFCVPPSSAFGSLFTHSPEKAYCRALNFHQSEQWKIACQWDVASICLSVREAEYHFICSRPMSISFYKFYIYSLCPFFNSIIIFFFLVLNILLRILNFFCGYFDNTIYLQLVFDLSPCGLPYIINLLICFHIWTSRYKYSIGPN